MGASVGAKNWLGASCPPAPTVRPTTDSESVAGGASERAGDGRDAVAGGQDDPPRDVRDEPAAALPDAGLRVFVGARHRTRRSTCWSSRRVAALTADDDAAVGGDVAVGGERDVDDAVRAAAAPGRCISKPSLNGTPGVLYGVPEICTGKPGRSSPVVAESACRYQWRAGDALAGLQARRHVDGPGRGVDHRRRGRAEVGLQIRAADRRGFERLCRTSASSDRAGGGVEPVGVAPSRWSTMSRAFVDAAAARRRRRRASSRRACRSSPTGSPAGASAGSAGVPVVAQVVVAGGGHFGGRMRGAAPAPSARSSSAAKHAASVRTETTRALPPMPTLRSPSGTGASPARPGGSKPRLRPVLQSYARAIGVAVRSRGCLQAVVFDLDGVLVDSESAWDAARRALVAESDGSWRPRRAPTCSG